MSQLNEKKVSVKKIIIFLLIFTVLSSSVTIYLIRQKNDEYLNKNELLQNEKTENISDNLGIKSLEETYKENYIKIENIKATNGEKDEDGQYPIEINYVQIDGLKNSEIQDEINKKIKKEVSKYYKNNKYDILNVNARCTANFGNVLSIEIDVYQYNLNSEKSNYELKGINIDLTTGKDINFEDLFTNTAAIKTILTKSIYDTLSISSAGGDFGTLVDEEEYPYDTSNYDEQYDESYKKEIAQKQEMIEDETFKILSYYNNGGNLDFSFSPRCIHVYKDDLDIQIRMKDYYSQIAIYNRYKENSDIYNNKYISHDIIGNEEIPVFLATNDENVRPDLKWDDNDISYINCYKASSDLFCNVVIAGNINEKDEIYEEGIKQVKEYIKTQIEKETKDEAKYIEYFISINTYEDSYEMTTNVYELKTNLENSKAFFSPIIEHFQDGNYNLYYNSEEDDEYGYIWKDSIKDKKQITQSSKELEKKYDSVNNKWLNFETVNNDDTISKEETEKTEEPKSETNQSQNNKVIVIDPGHQEKANLEQEPIGPGATIKKAKVTGGAVGVATGQTEADLNLKVSKLLQERLEQKGYKVIMTRTTNKVNISNSERAQIANDANADAFIRIHANSSETSSAKGVLTMCQTPNNIYNGNLAKESYKLSKLIVDKIATKTGFKNRGVTQTDDMSGINWSKVPVSIVEMGFLSNPDEDKNLADEGYQFKIVDAIVEAIEEFL